MKKILIAAVLLLAACGSDSAVETADTTGTTVSGAARAAALTALEYPDLDVDVELLEEFAAAWCSGLEAGVPVDKLLRLVQDEMRPLGRDALGAAGFLVGASTAEACPEYVDDVSDALG